MNRRKELTAENIALPGNQDTHLASERYIKAEKNIGI